MFTNNKDVMTSVSGHSGLRQDVCAKDGKRSMPSRKLYNNED